MNDGHFDDWTRRLATATSRRGVLRGLARGVAAGVLSLGAGRSARALTCREAGSTCREDANCCSGYCGPKDAARRRYCECPAPTVDCNGQCVDPATAFQSDVENCGSCGNRCSAVICHRPICVDGGCDVEANPDATGTPCDDGDPCTEADVCQPDGSCAGTPVVCTALDQCHDVGTCDSATGQCTNPLKAENTPCDDGNLCTTDDTCQAGVCTAGNPVSCVQFDSACADGVCDPATGQCGAVNRADGSDCAIVNGICSSGVCILANGEACPADDACQSGYCIAGFCQFGLSQATGPCDDDTDCTTNLLVCDSKNGSPQCLWDFPAQCISSYECATGRVCDSTVSLCQAGLGSPCVLQADCSADQDLYCDATTQTCQRLQVAGTSCTSYEQCVTNNCQTNIEGVADVCCYLSGNGPCLTDTDCCQPFRPVQVSCRDGICQDAATVAGTACAKDNDCDADSNGNDLICCQDTGDPDFGTCVLPDDCPGPPPPVKKGGYCSSTEECEAGLTCIGCSAGGTERKCLDQDNGCCRSGEPDPYLCGDSENACCNYECTLITGSDAIANCGECGNDCAALAAANGCFEDDTSYCDFDGNCRFTSVCPSGYGCQPTVTTADDGIHILVDWQNVTCVEPSISQIEGCDLHAAGGWCITDADCCPGLVCTTPCSGPYDWYCIFHPICTPVT